MKDPIRILLVEDNPADALLLQKILANSKTAYSLDVAEDGEIALDGLYDNDRMLPQIILLDMNMPKRNGIEILKEVKSDERLKHIPTLMLTSSKSEEDVITSYGLGAASYVNKPGNVEDHKKLLEAFDKFWFGVAILPN